MNTIAATLVATIVLLPLTASAEIHRPSASDVAYCAALSEKYVRYVGSSESSPRKLVRRSDLTGRLALAKCGEGDTATAIPILEQKLANAKVELPPRN